MKTPISQSLMNELTEYDFCPQHLKFKFVEGVQGVQTPAMLNGNYFEHFVLGSTRDGELPEFERVNRKNLKPTKSATKKVKLAYLEEKGMNPKEGDDLDEILDLMPEDKTEGDKPAAQVALDELVTYALNILLLMGIKPETGDTQVEIAIGDLRGFLDHVNADFQKPERKAIYDLKYTELQENDKWQGWVDLTTKPEALNQARHYIKLYHMKYGEWVPFYFLVFGKSKWVKCFKVTVSEEAMEAHDNLIQMCREQMVELEKKDFPANPKFNKCAKCEFNNICDFRKTTPEIEEVNL